MEPKFSSPELNAPNPERSPDQLPQIPNPEISPDFPLPSLERANGPSPERAPEQAAQAQAALSAQPIPITLPTPIAIQNDDAQATVSTDYPSVAADDDLIEKEWVDKAKQIISDTRDDPAAREKQVSRLQSDYLKKRYGKDLGASAE